MSETRDSGQHSEKPARKREMSRRQFLTYTLGGTGAFLAVTPLVPMIRFAVDPLLQSAGDSDFVRVAPVDEITAEPKKFNFQRVVTDGWYVDEGATFTAWISRDENGNIFALSPVCKHLGCTVDWNTNPDLPNEYYCPCHGAHYTKNGKDLAVAQGPLDEYEVDIRNGYVYLGRLKPNSRV
jgi:menaquinol-cytochrome c reductase iron-sulfur subunit